MMLLILLAVLGHAYIWVALVNRSHAVGWPQRWVHALTVAMFVLAAGIPGAITGALFWQAGWALDEALGRLDKHIWSLPGMAQAYLGACVVGGVWAVGQWAVRMVLDLRRPKMPVRSRVSRLVPPKNVPLAEPPTDAIANCSIFRHVARGVASRVARLPLNESLCLEEVERSLELAGLPESLSGLTILHVSDVHLTGLIDRWYFAEVVRRCNLREPDLVALTGDVADEEACIDWIPDTLGRLKARWGVYFILGNHDRRVDSRRLRSVLRAAGMVDVGGGCLELAMGAERLLLAGNELPWFAPAADFRDAPPPSRAGGPLRIALAHSPDQLPWARRNDVDLLLVGHTHGGQVCFPLIGPIFCPCVHGVRYTRGLYYAAPTVMHVSKGLSAEIPLRLGAPPEIVTLTLHPPTEASSHRSTA